MREKNITTEYDVLNRGLEIIVALSIVRKVGLSDFFIKTLSDIDKEILVATIKYFSKGVD